VPIQQIPGAAKRGEFCRSFQPGDAATETHGRAGASNKLELARRHELEAASEGLPTAVTAHEAGRTVGAVRRQAGAPTRDFRSR
jgi:hypothetical protein